jgi:hypothetical protein
MKKGEANKNVTIKRSIRQARLLCKDAIYNSIRMHRMLKFYKDKATAFHRKLNIILNVKAVKIIECVGFRPLT